MKELWTGETVLNADAPEYRIGLPQVTDISEEEAVTIEVELMQEGLSELEVVLYPLLIARPEFFPSIKASVTVSGKGPYRVDIPLEQFEFRQMVRAFLNYLDAVSFRVVSGGSVLLKRVWASGMGEVEIRAEKDTGICSKEEWVSYPLLLQNQSRQQQFINIRQCLYGKECLPTNYPKYVTLAAEEKKEIEIKVHMTADIPAGGLEKSTFVFVPNGNGAQRKNLTFYTLREKAHPYLVLKEEQWEERGKRIEEDDKLRDAFARQYEQAAARWNVPEKSLSGEFVYPSYSQNDLFCTAVAWKITGKDEYRQKVMEFFIGLLDEEHGYLSTRTSYFAFIEKKEEYARGDFKVCRAQNAGWVQEAEFFSKVCMAYDLLYNYFTREQHQKMEACLRNYMKFAAWRLTDGDGNNFQIAEGGAGLLCALVLQDYKMIERFLYGYNGYADLLSSVFLDDGMYFEEASGYTRLAGELYFNIVNAAENFGISLKDMKVPASFDRNILHSPWAMRESWAEDGKPFLGMSFKRFEEFTKADRTLKDYFDCTAKLLTKQGIMFSLNDSNEQCFTELYKKAYYLYRVPLYKEIADLSDTPEVLFVPKEDTGFGLGEESVLLKAAGLGILREKESQAVLKFGGHGGYHGHFDRLSLASFIRDGQTFGNNEYAWFGYDSFLFKMWVQTSVAHNMVVVDQRMQKPSPCTCIYYEADGKAEGIRSEGDSFKAVCAQTATEWIDPPYGGQTPYPLVFPEEKCAKEGRFIITAETPRKQGEIGEYSEPVFQRRLLVLFHEYCIVWDYLQGEEEHRYDCLYHPVGRFENEDGLALSYAGRFDENPFGAGQFILGCYRGEGIGSICLKFHDAPLRVNGNDILDYLPETAIWRVYPEKGTVTIGKYPHGTDTFTKENLERAKGHFSQPGKKTVSFSQTGKEGKFLTLLESGKKIGRIRKVWADAFDHVTIEEADETKWRIEVLGIEGKDTKHISVKVQKIFGGT